ncbi:hypothetical protein ABZ297_19995 [Nonomuraea sp. NPDC005983]|uniref:hypothetical protein n=1 Tax=Nonomuraea sp. NPDC005983 TaxID=3155595 RepID=UPI0033B2AFDE
MRYAWLCHPATVVAVIVLLLNDHLLKQAWPGLVTGKLSDVAGLVVAPPLVALLFRRRADAVAVLLTGALFAVVKSTETGADAASQVWSLLAGPSRVLADSTDLLLALPALAVAWWVRQRTWRDSWEQPEYRREWLARRYGYAPGVRPRALAVQARPGGHVVVVAGGLDGIVVRETSGEWRRVGWPGPLASIEDDDGVLDPERNVAIVLAVAMLLGSVATGLRRYYPAFTVFATAGCFGLYVLLEAPEGQFVLGFDPTKLAAGLGLTALAVVVCGLLAIAGRARPSRVAIPRRWSTRARTCPSWVGRWGCRRRTPPRSRWPSCSPRAR